MRKREAEPNVLIVPIKSISIRTGSRDDTPAILWGLQHIYVDDMLYEEVMTLLETHVATDRDHGNRPGMKLWNMLVPATMKQGLRIDYDRLRDTSPTSTGRCVRCCSTARTTISSTRFTT